MTERSASQATFTIERNYDAPPARAFAAWTSCRTTESSSPITMTAGENRITASRATMQFKPAGSATRPLFTEQGAFLDGYDDAGKRQEGSRGLLQALAVELKRQGPRTERAAAAAGNQ